MPQDIKELMQRAAFGAQILEADPENACPPTGIVRRGAASVAVEEGSAMAPGVPKYLKVDQGGVRVTLPHRAGSAPPSSRGRRNVYDEVVETL